ncbi:hypothetical protein CTI14_68935, partial [Methylobacterium radiotolerans]
GSRTPARAAEFTAFGFYLPVILVSAGVGVVGGGQTGPGAARPSSDGSRTPARAAEFTAFGFYLPVILVSAGVGVVGGG